VLKDMVINKLFQAI